MLLAHPRLVMFAQNICLLIFLLTIAVVGVVFLFAAWTGSRALAWKRQRARSEAEYRQSRFDSNGARLPDAGRGICEVCETASDEVLHLADGSRRCRACYQAAQRSTDAAPASIDP